MSKSFTEAGLSQKLEDGLKKQGITSCTPIQEKIIPVFMSKKDIIAQSETGSGKTLAYLLPLFMKIDAETRNNQAIVLTPTHELAAQVEKQAVLLAENSGIPVKSILVIGGASMLRQIEKLREKPQLIIGSPGRILELIKKRKIMAHTIKTIVVDEADRLLDDLNYEEVYGVIHTTLKERQLVMLSASMDKKIVEKAKELMNDPQLIRPSDQPRLPGSISHYYIRLDKREKIEMLRKIIHGEKPEKAIVFLNNPENIEVTVEKLNYHGIKATGIYGQAYKNDRKNAMDQFREGRVSVLVASDIGASGLDIAGITHVINMDIPEEPVYYLHRAGRTGRGGQQGKVISLVTDYEKKFIGKYERAFGIKILPKTMSYGKLSDVKEEVRKDRRQGGYKNEKGESGQKTPNSYQPERAFKQDRNKSWQNEKRGQQGVRNPRGKWKKYPAKSGGEKPNAADGEKKQ